MVGGGLLSAYSPDEAGPIRTTLIFDGKGFHAQKTAGGGRRRTGLCDGQLHHRPLVATTLTSRLATEGKTPSHLRARFGRLIADGSASGQLRIAGDDQHDERHRSHRRGGLPHHAGRHARRASSSRRIPRPWSNLTAETGQARRVQLAVGRPARSCAPRRSPGGKIAITYRGDTGAYTVKGSTGVQGGEIYYFDRSFIMKKGSITFNEDQTTFDPWITARAEVTRVGPDHGRRGEDLPGRGQHLQQVLPALQLRPVAHGRADPGHDRRADLQPGRNPGARPGGPRVLGLSSARTGSCAPSSRRCASS